MKKKQIRRPCWEFTYNSSNLTGEPWCARFISRNNKEVSRLSEVYKTRAKARHAIRLFSNKPIREEVVYIGQSVLL